MLADCYPADMPRFPGAAAAALAALLALPAAAGPFVPGGNGAALARGFALPALGETAVPRGGVSAWRLGYEVANEFVVEGACAVECLVLDGETRRLRLDYRAGLGDGWDVSLHVPWVKRGGGFLDGWIEDWHGWWGLPNGGREAFAQDAFQYRYRRGATVLLDETEGASGLGDVSVGLGRSLGGAGALRALVKTDSGDGPALSGGNAGAAVWLDLALPLSHGWDGYFAAGWSRNELGEVLTSMQNREVVFGGLGLLAPLADGVRLLLQLNAHTRLYDGSALTGLARVGVPLTVGLQIRTGDDGVLDIGFQEDPSVNGSPDFVFYVSLATLPRR
jgi:hypothetical protein